MQRLPYWCHYHTNEKHLHEWMTFEQKLAENKKKISIKYHNKKFEEKKYDRTDRHMLARYVLQI